jgi:acid phosphatase type 7
MVVSRRTFLQVASAAACLSRAARAASLIRQPYLQNVGATRASVLWTTAEAGTGTVTVTDPKGSSLTVTAAMEAFQPPDTQMGSVFYQYQADVTGLRDETKYTYSVAIDGQNLASDPDQFYFRTGSGDRFSFLAFGDSGADSSQQKSLVQLMLAEQQVSMVVHIGDMAYPDGTFEELETAYYGVNAPLMSHLPFFATPGNHEYITDSAAPYLAGVAAPACGVPSADSGRYYSFNWGNAHFVALDSNLLATSRASAMLAWLDADLAATEKYWRIVFLHHTPYPTGFHVGDPICADVQQLVNPIVEAHGVQLLLAGHEHGYERTYPLSGGQLAAPSSAGTTYVVTGGGGGALETVGSTAQTAISVQAFHYLRVDIDGTSLTLRAIGLDGAQIDQVSLGVTRDDVSIGTVLMTGDYTAPVAPGSRVAISGTNLASVNAVSPAYPLPHALGGVSLKAAGQPVPLLSVSPNRIQAQMPYRLSGPVTLELSTPLGSASAGISLSPVAPSLLEVKSQNRHYSIGNPARPGGCVSLYLTGLGEVDRGIETGQAAPSSLSVISPLEVWLGSTRLQPLFAGLMAGHAGIYRVDVVLPSALPDGIYAMRVVAGGVSSRPANLDVVSQGHAYRHDRAVSQVQS